MIVVHFDIVFKKSAYNLIMKKTISLLTLTLFFSIINVVFAEMSCETFAKELNLASWDNKGICIRV